MRRARLAREAGSGRPRSTAVSRSGLMLPQSLLPRTDQLIE
jgi:hypothetical protein